MIAVRLARATGNGASLYPEWCKSVEQVPIDLLKAISHANKILDWYENLIEKDVPPEWMWPFDKALKEWFEDVKARREHPEDHDDRTQVPMMDNDLAKGRR